MQRRSEGTTWVRSTRGQLKPRTRGVGGGLKGVQGDKSHRVAVLHVRRQLQLELVELVPIALLQLAQLRLLARQRRRPRPRGRPLRLQRRQLGRQLTLLLRHLATPPSVTAPREKRRNLPRRNLWTLPPFVSLVRLLR
eukprot:3246507-Pyramimonas_sp.AAC.1